MTCSPGRPHAAPQPTCGAAVGARSSARGRTPAGSRTRPLRAVGDPGWGTPRPRPTFLSRRRRDPRWSREGDAARSDRRPRHRHRAVGGGSQGPTAPPRADRPRRETAAQRVVGGAVDGRPGTGTPAPPTSCDRGERATRRGRRERAENPRAAPTCPPLHPRPARRPRVVRLTGVQHSSRRARTTGWMDVARWGPAPSTRLTVSGWRRPASGPASRPIPTRRLARRATRGRGRR